MSLQLSEKRVLVLDSGTGIRGLGKARLQGDDEFFILLSHAHWDHVQGFPFFGPLYQPGRQIYMFPSAPPPGSICGLCQAEMCRGNASLVCPLLTQMDGAHFPVRADQAPARPQCILQDELQFLASKGFELSAIATNHPGGGRGYRLRNAGRTLVYLTDNELEPPSATTTSFEEFVEFCGGADLLIHDAQYVEPDMPQKHGWGHSLVSQACRLARAARVEHLILYHHDPDRTDEELDRIQRDAERWLQEKSPGTKCSVAHEGLKLTF